MLNKIVHLPDADGDEIEVSFPAKYEVCWRCRGTGVHDPEGFSGGFTSSEMAEMGSDFREEYAAGRYDVTCSVCGGERVTLEIDEEHAHPKLLEAHRAWADQKAQWDAEDAHERRMGC